MWAMALGKRRRERQETLWIPTGQVAKSPSHPFYKRLDAILVDHQFDDFVEKICAKFYAPRMGRPGLAPGLYFRLLLIGYFEGLDSERGIAWRTADSLALRDFLGLTELSHLRGCWCRKWLGFSKAVSKVYTTFSSRPLLPQPAPPA